MPSTGYYIVAALRKGNKTVCPVAHVENRESAESLCKELLATLDGRDLRLEIRPADASRWRAWDRQLDLTRWSITLAALDDEQMIVPECGPDIGRERLRNCLNAEARLVLEADEVLEERVANTAIGTPADLADNQRESPGSGAGPGSDPEDDQEPPLTSHDATVLKTMSRFDGSQLLIIKMISAEMDPEERLSERTIGEIVRKLVKQTLAERPEGDRQGVRLTSTGRQLAAKIAD